MQTFASSVESTFYRKAGNYSITAKMPYILVDNFPLLGKLTALRFLEWVSGNPDGVVSLPTGKTPEFFIKWTMHLLNNWNAPEMIKLREENGLHLDKKPILAGLQFVQLDEFYPISPEQHNSFYHYIRNFYIDGFGLDECKALLVNCNEIPLAKGKSYREVFPGHRVDLSLRYRECRNELDLLQQESIFRIDQWCMDYERKIQDKGGIGFFLGGIGPDGHIAFNIKGSDHGSTTRLTSTNFETQAVAATDLGGIEVSRNRMVITIGLGTITYNPNAVAIIIAAGEAKAEVVRNALENPPNNLFPATALQKLPNGRFYLTLGAASLLNDCRLNYYKRDSWNTEKTERAIIDLTRNLDKYDHHITEEEIHGDPFASLIPVPAEQIVPSLPRVLPQ